MRPRGAAPARRSPRLDGAVVLVTGAARGIGAATARELATRGAHVAVLDRDGAGVHALATELGADHAAYTADVTDQASLDAAVAAIVQRFGRLDMVLANAGVAQHGTILINDSDAFARGVDVNLVGVHRTVTAALPHLLEHRGYVLMLGSVASFVPLPGGGAYSPTKAGVESLAGLLRIELAPVGVGVGSAHPSWIDTDMVRGAEEAMPTFRELRAKLPWPVRATITPEVCARVLVDGMARRARRVYVPRSIVIVSALRSLLVSPLAERLARRSTGSHLAQLDREVLAARAAATPTTPATHRAR